jgi:hypothetical protein
LSETLRISRGNKGTTFILIKEDDWRLRWWIVPVS